MVEVACVAARPAARPRRAARQRGSWAWPVSAASFPAACPL